METNQLKGETRGGDRARKGGGVEFSKRADKFFPPGCKIDKKIIK